MALTGSYGWRPGTSSLEGLGLSAQVWDCGTGVETGCFLLYLHISTQEHFLKPGFYGWARELRYMKISRVSRCCICNIRGRGPWSSLSWGGADAFENPWEEEEWEKPFYTAQLWRVLFSLPETGPEHLVCSWGYQLIRLWLTGWQWLNFIISQVPSLEAFGFR